MALIRPERKILMALESYSSHRVYSLLVQLFWAPILVTQVGAQVEISADLLPPSASLEGQIVDSVSGDPIPGVLVRTDSGHEAFTDPLGRFELTALPEGNRLLALMTADCRITWGQVTVCLLYTSDAADE